MQIEFSTKSPWISIKNRKPPLGKLVMVYSEWDDSYSIGYLIDLENNLWSIQEDFFNFLLVDYWKELDDLEAISKIN